MLDLLSVVRESEQKSVQSWVNGLRLSVDVLFVGVTVRCERRWTSAGATPTANWFAPPDGNRSRLFLGNEKHKFLANLSAGSRPVYNTRAST
jgi:hypothetical protein